MATLMVAACLAGVDAQGLQAVDGGRFPAAMDADLGLDNSLAASITLHSGARLAVLRAPDGDRVVLGRVTTQDVHVSLNVMGALRAGLALPRYKPVIFDDQRVSGAVAGDFGFFVQGPLVQGDRGRASLSAQLDLPLGGVDVWLGEPDPALEVLFAGERDLGRFQVIGNLGPRLTRQTTVPGMRWGNAWKYVAGGRWSPWGPLAATAELFGRVPLNPFSGAPGNYPLEVLVTADLMLGPVTLGFGGGTGLTRGLGSPDGRMLGRVDIRPRRVSDRDGDGVGDVRDVCPALPEDLDDFRDLDGCPDPDDDEDGVLDARDVCRRDPEIVNGWRDDDGCPDAPAELSVEVGPDERPVAELRVAGQVVSLPAGGETLIRVEAGSHELIASAEGFLPWSGPVLVKAETVTRQRIELDPVPVGRLRLTAVDPEGSPLAAVFRPEGGGDPVEVAVDGLLLEGPPGEIVGVMSAPGRLPAAVRVDRVDGDGSFTVVLAPARLDAGVAFELDRAELGPLAQATLQAVADQLRSDASIRLLRVEGHADDQGTSAHNHVLSVARANAVRDALIGLGVEPGRLEAVGSGEASGVGRQVGFLPLVWD